MSLPSRRHRLLPFLLPLALIAACSADGDDPGGDPGGTGGVTVTLTDAASDELACFMVEISAISLTRATGAQVGVLSTPVSVDLLSLTDLSQVLSVLQLPAGLYSAATVTMDFSEASTYLVDSSIPATILNSTGAPLTGQVTLPITIGDQLNVPQGQNQVLELDFDLDQSVSVDTPANEVVVEPVIVLRSNPGDPKDILVVGEVVAVDAPANRIDVEFQTLGGAPLGQLQVTAESTTVFQVDGAPSTGSTGLDALSQLGAGVWIQCYGAIQFGSGSLAAAYVYAGSGTYNGGDDIVDGYILSRSVGAGGSPLLNVIGFSQNAAHTSFQFNTTFSVGTDFAGSRVVRQGSSTAFDTDALNVGQRVRVFGSLAGVNMDATDGVVRMEPTKVFGFANAAASGGSLEMDLTRVGPRLAGIFTWSDAGTTPPTPAAFGMGVGGLSSGLGIEAGTAVESTGFFPSLQDSGPDFGSLSLVNRDAGPTLLSIRDGLGGFTVLTTASANEVSFDIDGTPGFFEWALVDRGFVGITPLPTTPDPRIVPQGAFGFYFVIDRRNGSSTLHLDFPDYTAQMNQIFSEGGRLTAIRSTGPYDETQNVSNAGLSVAIFD